MVCQLCDGKMDQQVIFENDKIKVLLSSEPAALGHLQLFCKEHYSILEEIPDDLLAYMSASANKLSMLLFQLLKVHGTNIIIQNGVPSGQTVPHFSMHIIPRRSEDGIKLDWNLKQAAPEALDSMQRIISEGMNKNTPAPAPVEAPKQIEEKKPEPEELKKHPDHKKTNYFLKALERIP